MVDRSPGFFDLEDRLAELSAKGGSLERVQLAAAVPRADRSKGGRPAFPA
jgi:IS5 family transposase